jgi:hypothetical protein
MAKRNNTTTRSTKTTRSNARTKKTKAASGAIERRVLAVAEQVGWVAGKLASATRRSKPAPSKRPRKNPRSGGAVDAPGKKHRKPAPVDPRVARMMGTSASMLAADRAAAAASKTTRRYSRG